MSLYDDFMENLIVSLAFGLCVCVCVCVLGGGYESIDESTMDD